MIYKKKLIYILITLTLLITVYLLFTRIPVLSTDELTPDSKLYNGLAQNIITGVGYQDTIRNNEILPPVGHPLIIAVYSFLGIPFEFTKTFILISILFLSLSIYLYTKKVIFVLVNFIFLFVLLKHIGLYKLGIESSGLISSSLLILSLTYMYAARYSLFSKIVFVFSATIHLLVRPTLLYPLVFAFIFLLFLITYKAIRSKKIELNHNIKSWLEVVSTILILMLTVNIYSKNKYNDSRLTRGTYAAMNLYLSNNEYINPKQSYNTDLFFKYIPEMDKKIFLSKEIRWEEREHILFSKFLDYVKKFPKRAATGLLWRLKKYTCSDCKLLEALSLYRLLVYFILLLSPVLVFKAFSKSQTHVLRDFTRPTLVIILLFFVQTLQLVFFSWTGPRYLIYLIPFLTTGGLFIIYDLIYNTWRKENDKE